MQPDTTTVMRKDQLGNLESQHKLARGQYSYHGNLIKLESELDELHIGKNRELKDAYIQVIGIQVKQKNQCCQIITWIFGSILIFPIFFMCCQWWRKIVYPAYQIPLNIYRKLQIITSSPTIKSFTLKVYDNSFDEQKANVLYDLLSKSTLKGFSFFNEATPNDFRSKQYSDFKNYMKKIKSLSIMTDLKWYQQIVI